MSLITPFKSAIAQEIWQQKYRLKAADGSPIDQSVDDTFVRVAKAAASAEKGGKKQREKWAEKFYAAIKDFAFLPAGRILAGAGSERSVTLFNCFVMGPVADDLGGIFEGVKQAAKTMQAGGGIGQDFSTLRPRGAVVQSIGADASGPVSFMDVWDSMCGTIMSAGARRGAMMATMRIDHPDIEDFIAAKRDAARLRNFNLSVLVTDAFMAAVREKASWDLVFNGDVYRTVNARALWDKIMRATYDYAEPGVIFIDRVNRANNLNYCEKIFATNPCGEQPLPAYGACLLGSINLAKLVTKPFKDNAGISLAALEEKTRLAVRFLDNIIDISDYPLQEQRLEALAKRRLGLGLTGLADALIMTGHRYDSAKGVARAKAWMSTIQHAAYEASCELAREKGAFPLFDKGQFLESENLARLAKPIRKAVAKNGLRNGCLTSIAPTGTISLFAGNVSSGIEPVFDFTYERRVLDTNGKATVQVVEDFAHARFKEKFGHDRTLPETFITTLDLLPKHHLAMQAALQPFVDSAISKTINCPDTLSFSAFKDIYTNAFDAGLKGCTTYKPNDVTGTVLAYTENSQESANRSPKDNNSQVEHVGHKPREHAIAPATKSPGAGDVVYMAEPLARAKELDGTTYKLKWPNGDQAIYITINDIEHDGRRRPFEIFINTRNLEHYAWTVALTRMISAVFRRGGDVSFVADELKAIFDPQGGCWIQGRYVPSLLAAIGDVIESHMVKIGFLQAAPDTREHPSADNELAVVNVLNNETPNIDASRAAGIEYRATTSAHSNHPGQPTVEVSSIDSPKQRAHLQNQKTTSSTNACPKCGARSLVHQEGCLVCRQCGFSQCR